MMRQTEMKDEFGDNIYIDVEPNGQAYVCITEKSLRATNARGSLTNEQRKQLRRALKRPKA